MFTKYKKYFYAFALVVLVVFLISLFIKKPEPTPKLISSLPASGSSAVGLNQSVRLAFDLPVSATDLTIVSIPAEAWVASNLTPESIELTHKYFFQPYTDYQLTVKQGATTLANLTFTTITSQSDPRLVQSIEEQMAIDYPLSRATPYDTPQFSVVYSSPLTLEITLKNTNLTSQEVIDNVKAWVTGNGGDPEAHHYTFASQ
jgi:hypothetical protein